MFWRLVPACVLCVVVVLASSSVVPSQSAEQEAAKPVFTGPPAAEEMKIFAPLLGKWKSTTTAKPTENNPQGFTAKGQSEAKLIHNGHWLQFDAQMESQRGRYDISTISGYDRRKGTYRRFTFDSMGVISESVGEWDAAASTMTWRSVNMAQGASAVAKATIVADKTTFSLLIKGADGSVIADSVTESVKGAQ